MTNRFLFNLSQTLWWSGLFGLLVAGVTGSKTVAVCALLAFGCYLVLHVIKPFLRQ